MYPAEHPDILVLERIDRTSFGLMDSTVVAASNLALADDCQWHFLWCDSHAAKKGLAEAAGFSGRHDQ